MSRFADGGQCQALEVLPDRGARDGGHAADRFRDGGGQPRQLFDHRRLQQHSPEALSDSQVNPPARYPLDLDVAPYLRLSFWLDLESTGYATLQAVRGHPIRERYPDASRTGIDYLPGETQRLS